MSGTLRPSHARSIGWLSDSSRCSASAAPACVAARMDAVAERRQSLRDRRIGHLQSGRGADRTIDGPHHDPARQALDAIGRFARDIERRTTIAFAGRTTDDATVGEWRSGLSNDPRDALRGFGADSIAIDIKRLVGAGPQSTGTIAPPDRAHRSAARSTGSSLPMTIPDHLRGAFPPRLRAERLPDRGPTGT